MLKDYAKGEVQFTYRDDCLLLFFSANRAAQLKMAPANQRQNIIAEMANRIQNNPDWEKTPVLADMIVWDILREEGWALPAKSVRPSSLSTIFQDGEQKSTE